MSLFQKGLSKCHKIYMSITLDEKPFPQEMCKTPYYLIKPPLIAKMYLLCSTRFVYAAQNPKLWKATNALLLIGPHILNSIYSQDHRTTFFLWKDQYKLPCSYCQIRKNVYFKKLKWSVFPFLLNTVLHCFICWHSFF